MFIYAEGKRYKLEEMHAVGPYYSVTGVHKLEKVTWPVAEVQISRGKLRLSSMTDDNQIRRIQINGTK